MFVAFLYSLSINITFPERVTVENIIPRYVIINRGAAEVDNKILGMIFLTIILSGNVIFILLYQTEN